MIYIDSGTKQDYASSSLFLLPFFRPSNGSFGLTSILSPRIIPPCCRIDNAEAAREKIIEFTDITSGEKRDEENTRKRMAHNRIDRWDFIFGLTAFIVNITENRSMQSSMAEAFYNPECIA